MKKTTLEDNFWTPGMAVLYSQGTLVRNYFNTHAESFPRTHTSSSFPWKHKCAIQTSAFFLQKHTCLARGMCNGWFPWEKSTSSSPLTVSMLVTVKEAASFKYWPKSLFGTSKVYRYEKKILGLIKKWKTGSKLYNKIWKKSLWNLCSRWTLEHKTWQE